MSYQVKSDRDELQEVGAMIWERRYSVKVPYEETLSLHALQTRGVPTTGFTELDQTYLKEMHHVVITIDEIAEYFRRGVRIQVIHYVDLEEMYNIINRYLAIWSRILRNSVNMESVPGEDLLLLDKLADKLYDQSRLFNGPRLSHRESMISFFGLTLAGCHTAFLQKLVASPAASADVAQHLSYAEVITTSLFGQPTGKTESDPSKPRSGRWS